jgi:hypothetical protein
MSSFKTEDHEVMGKDLKAKKPERERSSLNTFLCCVARPGVPISMIRGLDPVVRHIWELASSEWLDLHIERFPKSCVDPHGIAKLTLPWKEPNPVDTLPGMEYPYRRQICAGCPAATIALGMQFPPPANRYVNMMPFQINQIDGLPSLLAPYIPIIRQCLRFCLQKGEDIGYLTIDERQTEPGASQRRPGLHVESPGLLPIAGGELSDIDGEVQLRNGNYIPAAEHRWGRGLMMRQEKATGGIFMASNVANTTAVWNCQIHNEGGAFVGPHGDIERLRSLLGPPSHLLEAGELVWMTDHTPHESLPVPAVTAADGTVTVPHRQYFRLVLGEVSAWYADHSTLCERGVMPPSSVRIIRGDKFNMYPKMAPRFQNFGTDAQIAAAHALQEMRILLCHAGLGHLYEGLRMHGVCSVQALRSSLDPPADNAVTPSIREVLNDMPELGFGRSFYEAPAIQMLKRAVEQQENCLPADARVPDEAVIASLALTERRSRCYHYG